MVKTSLTQEQFEKRFHELTEKEKEIIRQVYTFQRNKRKNSKDNGWVPSMDLGGTSRNRQPAKYLQSLADEGMLESTLENFNGRRFRLAHEIPSHGPKPVSG